MYFFKFLFIKFIFYNNDDKKYIYIFAKTESKNRKYPVKIILKHKRPKLEKKTLL